MTLLCRPSRPQSTVPPSARPLRSSASAGRCADARPNDRLLDDVVEEERGDRRPMRVLEVIALEVGVEDELPVRRLHEASLVRARRGAIEAEPFELVGEGAELVVPGEVAERLGNDPDQAAAHDDRQRHEAARAARRVREVGLVRPADERAACVVRPALIRADEARAVVRRSASPGATIAPRWRQTLMKARRTPSSPRLTSSGTSSRRVLSQSPGAASRAAGAHGMRQAAERFALAPVPAGST